MFICTSFLFSDIPISSRGIGILVAPYGWWTFGFLVRRDEDFALFAKWWLRSWVGVGRISGKQPCSNTENRVDLGSSWCSVVIALIRTLLAKQGRSQHDLGSTLTIFFRMTEVFRNSIRFDLSLLSRYCLLFVPLYSRTIHVSGLYQVSRLSFLSWWNNRRCLVLLFHISLLHFHFLSKQNFLQSRFGPASNLKFVIHEILQHVVFDAWRVQMNRP